MEFWGAQVKAGQPLRVVPDPNYLIHVSQAALGEIKNGKGPKRCYLRLKVDGETYVIGTLSAEENPQIMFDLVFEKEFELSHDWKDGSVHIAGYMAFEGGDGSEEEDSEEEMELDTPSVVEPKKKEVAKVFNNKPTSDEEDDDEDDSDFSGEDDIKMVVDEDDSDSEDESDSEDDSDKNVPVLVPQKKTTVTPPAAKMVNLTTNDKGKGKALATNGKLKEQNPKAQKSSKPNAQQSKAKHGRK